MPPGRMEKPEFPAELPGRMGTDSMLLAGLVDQMARHSCQVAKPVQMHFVRTLVSQKHWFVNLKDWLGRKMMFGLEQRAVQMQMFQAPKVVQTQMSLRVPKAVQTLTLFQALRAARMQAADLYYWFDQMHYRTLASTVGQIPKLQRRAFRTLLLHPTLMVDQKVMVSGRGSKPHQRLKALVRDLRAGRKLTLFAQD